MEKVLMKTFQTNLRKKTFEKNQKGNFEKNFLINLRKNYTENWNKNQNTKVFKKQKRKISNKFFEQTSEIIIHKNENKKIFGKT
jgi:hypothetical protein